MEARATAQTTPADPPAEETAEDLAGLVALAAAGDDGAWTRLVERYGRRVYALAKTRLRDAELAEEVCQSVFVSTFQHLNSGRYTEQGRFEPWLFRVAMNRVRDALRRSDRRAVGDDAVARLASEGQARPAPAGSMDRLREAVAALPEADQQIISLRHHAGLGFKTIAELLDEPMGTLLARHHRALRKLRTILEPRTGESP